MAKRRRHNPYLNGLDIGTGGPYGGGPAAGFSDPNTITSLNPRRRHRNPKGGLLPLLLAAGIGYVIGKGGLGAAGL